MWHARQIRKSMTTADGRSMAQVFADIDFGRRWTQALAFRFGGDYHALWGAFAAAAAYARATGGVVFDGESGEVMPPDEAAATARDIERRLPSGG